MTGRRTGNNTYRATLIESDLQDFLRQCRPFLVATIPDLLSHHFVVRKSTLSSALQFSVRHYVFDDVEDLVSGPYASIQAS